MPKLWSILGVISIAIGIAFFANQSLGRHASWSWSQLHNYETAIFAAWAVGLALLVVALVEYQAYKRIKK